MFWVVLWNFYTVLIPCLPAGFHGALALRHLGGKGTSRLCSPRSVQPEDLHFFPFKLGFCKISQMKKRLYCLYQKKKKKTLKISALTSIAWINFMFEILVRTSHWEYSGCLLGIYSAKLTWRSCHGSYKGMTWISASVGGRCVLLYWYIAAWFQPTGWRGGPGGRVATVVGVYTRCAGRGSTECCPRSPCPPGATSDASLPLSSCLDTGSTLIGGPWRSLRSK